MTRKKEMQSKLQSLVEDLIDSPGKNCIKCFNALCYYDENGMRVRCRKKLWIHLDGREKNIGLAPFAQNPEFRQYAERCAFYDA